LPLLAGGGLAGGAAFWSDGAAAGGAAFWSEGAAAGGAAGGLLCDAGGGAALGSVPEESFFAHAVSISAAASAVRATLVFIDRYPDALLREPVRRKLSERLFQSFRESFMSRAAKFYRLSMRF
jgi:hypothetical protein